MPEVQKHDAGMFSWADLATTDPAAAKNFYTAVFGWEAEDLPLQEGGIYTMLRKNGKDAAALSEQQPQQREMGMPPVWNTYFTVDDADKIVTHAKELGGTIFAEPFDVMDLGRMAVIADPTGAVFSVWQPKINIGAQVFGEHGALTWAELWTNNLDEAREFYSELFGWSHDTQDYGTGPYTAFSVGDKPAAGMLAITPEQGERPPAWLVYFAVDDCDAVAKVAQDNGAQFMFEPTSLAGVGRFAIFADPQGAALGILQPEPPQQS